MKPRPAAADRRRGPGQAQLFREWIGGRLSTSFFVHDREEPCRPDIVLWLELPDGLVVGQATVMPGDADGAVARTLRSALTQPVVGSPRRPDLIRVADPATAAEARAEVAGAIPVDGAPTPELQELPDHLVASMPAGAGNAPSHFASGRVSPAAVGKLFPPPSVRGEAVGGRRRHPGNPDGHSRPGRGWRLRLRHRRPRRVPWHVDLPVGRGPRTFSRSGGRSPRGTCGGGRRAAVADLRARHRAAAVDAARGDGARVARGGSGRLSVGGADGAGRCAASPLIERDVEIATAAERSLGALFGRHSAAFESDIIGTACESYYDEDDREVWLTFPTKPRRTSI